MDVRKLPNGIVFVLILSVPGTPVWGAGKKKTAPPEEITSTGSAVLWKQPADLESRDLYYGPGGSGHAPHGVFTFVKEDLNGTNPKFVVRDRDGQEWKVKFGNEARPETVAARIVWAVGYEADEDYFMPNLQVRGMPARLHRGQKLISPGGSIGNARLKRESKDEKKLGDWRWRSDPFTGTREWNGLKVVMAVINNWDLKDDNNAIYQEGNERIYMVSDLGASFGSAGRTFPRERSKGDLDSYERSKFIRRVTASAVDFQSPARPSFVFLVDPWDYLKRVHLEWIGRNVPREDVLWMGNLLARLSTRQIRDAFRAAGYSPEETSQFADAVQKRIAIITEL
jgi:hypothetical protein